MKKPVFAFLFTVLLLPFGNDLFPCTNIIVTKGASKDGSVMITYAADSHTRYGALTFYPAADHNPGAMLDVFHYESGKLLGQIPEVAHTYSVIGFMNEHQVAIGETTFGGLDSLQSQPGAILDYGSLMKIGLQRAKSARELIRVITELVSQYGYASSGESLSISDANEAWIMEIIGKGRFEKGAVWVALRVPEGYVSGHANQARITTFPFVGENKWNDPAQSCFHSPDVSSFARKHGFYEGSDSDFSFADTYHPITFGGARFCDARVWSVFRKLNGEVRENSAYTDYAMGKIQRSGKSVSNRFPLWVRADQKIGLEDMFAFMRDHYEETPLQFDDGIGAGPYHLPYRWRPMEFTVDSITYLHERSIATQQTGYSFIAQSRSWLPDAAGGVFWFGVDDADGCVYAPMYCGITAIPESYAVGNGSMIRWSETSAFWTFNLVTNWAYTRYDAIHPEIEKYQSELEGKFITLVSVTDHSYLNLVETDPAGARKILTDFSVSTGNGLVADWKEMFHYLFMKYMDGNVKQTEGRQLLDNGNGKGVPKRPSQPGYGKEWEREMVEGTGDRYKVIH
jgi:dipeptidase